MPDSYRKKQKVFKENNKEQVTKDKDESTKTHSGLDENIAGALCYVAWIITAIIFLVIEKENPFIRFHALQSLITFIAFFIITIVLTIIPFIGWIISLLLTPAIFILWLFMMWKAYQGERFKLPIIGNMVENQLNK